MNCGGRGYHCCGTRRRRRRIGDGNHDHQIPCRVLTCCGGNIVATTVRLHHHWFLYHHHVLLQQRHRLLAALLAALLPALLTALPTALPTALATALATAIVASCCTRHDIRHFDFDLLVAQCMWHLVETRDDRGGIDKGNKTKTTVSTGLTVIHNHNLVHLTVLGKMSSKYIFCDGLR